MSRNIKKALNPDDIKKLISFYDFEGSPKLRARDFWLLSFYCYGMNVCDILQLRNDNLDGKVLHFYRNKTKHSSRKDQKPVLVSLDERAVEIINKYRNSDIAPNCYLFPILNKEDSAKDARDKIKNFTRYINQHIKKIAIIEGIDPKISSYYARHSAATIAADSGILVDKISAMLAHSNIITTQKYLDSLPLDQARKLSDTIYSNI
ncbi:MAG: tyrosine-type recombinase/integrase [Saprospiraceae bacterium]|nr:tyrosine-type recombinase/integrase [Saprospiraceae bacterium]